jgi:hypothetical protein
MPKNPQGTNSCTVQFFWRDGSSTTNTNVHHYCNVTNCNVVIFSYHQPKQSFQLLWHNVPLQATKIFNNKYPFLEHLDPLVALRFTPTSCAVFGQLSCIDFCWFDTSSKSNHQSHLLFGAWMQESCHLQQLIISASNARRSCVFTCCYQKSSTPNIKLGLFHITNFTLVNFSGFHFSDLCNVWWIKRPMKDEM